MASIYAPSQKILDKYADVLVNFALNHGAGIKKREVVFLEVPECAKPMLISLQKAVLKAGGHYITHYLPDDVARHFYELAEEHQIEFFPEHFLQGKVKQADHSLAILAETNPHELEGIDPKKIMRRSSAHKPYRDWRDEKEIQGKFSWTLALYGTEAQAKEAGLSLEEYWKQIIQACYLDFEDPVGQWRKSFIEIARLKNELNKLDIKKIQIKSSGIDLTVGIGENRKWMGGDGCNIPSFEVFISPDCRMTEGHVYFNQPLYIYGNLINDVYLEFKDGKVVKASAKKGENILKEMIAVAGANMIGEFSLTDVRLSKINKFMAETLYDENFGGSYGNMHIALGAAYKESYPGDTSKVLKKQWAEMGYNDSVVHTDIVSSEDREVFAYLKDGSKKLIYHNGRFNI